MDTNFHDFLLPSSSFRLGVTTIFLIILSLLCIVGTFPCHWPLGLLLLKGGHGIFKVRNCISAFCAHEGETGIDVSAVVSEE